VVGDKVGGTDELSGGNVMVADGVDVDGAEAQEVMSNIAIHQMNQRLCIAMLLRLLARMCGWPIQTQIAYFLTHHGT